MLRIILAFLTIPADLPTLVQKQGAALVEARPPAAVVVGVLDGDRERVYPFGSWGGKAPDRDSVYEIGSVTKAFTGTLLAASVKAGVVKLDDPAQSHLPDGWTLPRRDDRDVTLLHLATHTSGLTRLPHGSLPFLLAEPKNPYAKFDPPALQKGLPDTPVRQAIGARHEYSNLGVGLLGHALAHASNVRTYEQALTDRVLKPLAMADTGIALAEGRKQRLIPGHTEAGNPQGNWDFGCIEACGALRSTAGDLLKFVKANAFPAGPLADGLRSAQQSWREIQPGRHEIGLCWMRFVDKKAPPLIWHNGQTGGYHAFVGFVPGRGGVVVLCNVATGKVDDVGFAVLKHLAGQK